MAARRRLQRMRKGSVSDLFRALIPVGTVKAVRQEYEVLRTAGGDYLVFSPSGRGSSSYHMTMVSSGRVEALSGAMGKGGVTAGSLLKDEELEATLRVGDGVTTRFDILIGLYVLVASGRAEMKRVGRSLVFTKRAPDG